MHVHLHSANINHSALENPEDEKRLKEKQELEAITKQSPQQLESEKESLKHHLLDIDQQLEGHRALIVAGTTKNTFEQKKPSSTASTSPSSSSSLSSSSIQTSNHDNFDSSNSQSSKAYSPSHHQVEEDHDTTHSSTTNNKRVQQFTKPISRAPNFAHTTHPSSTSASTSTANLRSVNQHDMESDQNVSSPKMGDKRSTSASENSSNEETGQHGNEENEQGKEESDDEEDQTDHGRHGDREEDEANNGDEKDNEKDEEREDDVEDESQPRALYRSPANHRSSSRFYYPRSPRPLSPFPPSYPHHAPSFPYPTDPYAQPNSPYPTAAYPPSPSPVGSNYFPDQEPTQFEFDLPMNQATPVQTPYL